MTATTTLHPLAVLGKGATTGMLRGYCTTTFGALVAAMGMPHMQDGAGTAEWAFRCQDGTVFTVYCWNEERVPYGLHQWHVGGTPNALAAFERFTGLKALDWALTVW